MVLEATLLCLDNSDWTRNGDYFPCRFRMQVEAANFIIENRCDANPENSIGIMTMAGKRVEMISTLTNDESRLLGSVNNINLNGESDIISALNIAILCLKHRINKNQKQRIILFVGSPVKATKENLVQIGKKLRKYNVAVDIISFGNVEENKESLNTLLNEVNNSNNSSILEVEIGSNIVDALFTSSIIGANNVEQDVGGQGVNPQGNQQPMQLSQFERDMNLALQMSLEEAKKNDNKGSTATPSNINAVAEKNKTLEEIEEEQELENARLLSIQENNKVVQKENEAKEKKAANEILESQAFLNDLLNQVDQGDSSDKKEEDKKDDKKKGENKKDDKKEDKKDDKTKGDDKMDIEK